MSLLAVYSMLLGVALLATRLPGVVAPARYRGMAIAFPRSVWPGRILFGVALLWGAIVLYGALDEAVVDAYREGGNTRLWTALRAILPVATPVVYWLVIRFGAQYLAVRGASALALLVANHVVRAADMSVEPVRLVVTTLMYVWVTAAIWFTIAPHHLRDMIGWLMASDSRCRVTCGAGVVLGVVLLGLGLFVY